MAKDLFELKWIETLLPSGTIRKPMFGGFAYYLDSKLILTAFESPGDTSYKNKKFLFEIWHGLMFPCEKIHHELLLRDYPFLINHPVLPKWLYLPISNESFEENAEIIFKQIRKNSPFFGVIPKTKKPRGKFQNKIQSKTKNFTQSKIKNAIQNKIINKRSNHEKEKFEKIDTRFPRMFKDEPAENILSKAQRISDLKNLGPASENEFQKAGIKSAHQFIKLGWKKALSKLVKVNSKNRHSIFAYALIGALKNQEWNRISEEDKLEARLFVSSLKKPASSLKKKR